jgi:hypothetical protein
MAKFTEGFADRLTVPAGTKDVQVFDDELSGFGCRKYGSAKAVFFVKYNVGNQQRRKTLGRVIRGNLKQGAAQLNASYVKNRRCCCRDVVRRGTRSTVLRRLFVGGRLRGHIILGETGHSVGKQCH